MNDYGMLWSDNVDIENTKGWFGGGEFNGLFEVDFEKGSYKCLARFPDGDIDSNRRYTYCRKCSDKIFCFPVYGDRIWVYHLSDGHFSEIRIRHADEYEKLRFSEASVYAGSIYVLSFDLQTIFKINIEQECISDQIKIPESVGKVTINYACVGNLMYCVSTDHASICEINLDNSEIIIYNQISCKKGFNTIAQLTEDTFCLSGYGKELYIWNKKNNEITRVRDFPKDFGMYLVNAEEDKFILDCESDDYKEFAFIKSVNLGKYTWLIPMRTNNILMVDKDTYEITSFEMPNENETFESWKRPMNHKYLVEYVRENRFIGLYSFKNRVIVEIDTKELELKTKNLVMEQKSINMIVNELVQKNGILNENSEVHKRFFMLYKSGTNETPVKISTIGETIYKETVLR